jgi:hypothetical protein
MQLLLLLSVMTAGPVDKGPAVLLAAGDVADFWGGARATADLLDDLPGTVAALGDLAYERGTEYEFDAYYRPSWGRHKTRTRPTPGNHEYYSGGQDYFRYFGSRAGPTGKGWYAYDLGAWRVVVLNSNCEVVGCGPGSEQEVWLRAELANPRTGCTLAYWHHPLFSSGEHGDNPAVRPLWQALYEVGVDVVLAGHDHHYERFAPQDPSGRADPQRGIRQFVVGTGGRALYQLGEARPNSEVRDASTHGILKLTLDAGGYAWEFIPVGGQAFRDRGSDRCH